MRLVGETGAEGGFRKPRPLTHHHAGAIEPAHDEITMRTGAEGPAELAGDRVAVEAGDRFELSRTDIARAVGGEVIPAGKNAGREAAVGGHLTIIGMALQPVRDHCDDAGHGEFARVVIELGQRFPEPAAKQSVADDRIGDEGQASPAALGFDDPLGRHIDHPIDETSFGAGGPVMQLVGMQHDDIAGKARAQGAAIVEGLHARKRHADAVGVVPVRSKAVAGEGSLDVFEPRQPAEQP